MAKKIELPDSEIIVKARGDHVKMEVPWAGHGGTTVHKREVIALRDFFNSYLGQADNVEADLKDNEREIDALFKAIGIFIKEICRVKDEDMLTKDPEQGMKFLEGLTNGTLPEMIEAIESVPGLALRLDDLVKEAMKKTEEG